jgi:hypothetical protein
VTEAELRLLSRSASFILSVSKDKFSVCQGFAFIEMKEKLKRKGHRGVAQDAVRVRPWTSRNHVLDQRKGKGGREADAAFMVTVRVAGQEFPEAYLHSTATSDMPIDIASSECGV